MIVVIFLNKESYFEKCFFFLSRNIMKMIAFEQNIDKFPIES